LIRFRSLAIVALASLAGAAMAIPRVLIVQVAQPGKEGDPNLPVADFLAQNLDTEGRVSSIVWGVADPVFREAALSGKLKEVPDRPTVKQAIPVADRLGAEYVLSVKAFRSGKAVKGVVELYRGGRKVWSDEQNLEVSVSGAFDKSGTAESIARTIALRLNAGPFNSLTIKPKVETPEADKGQAPIQVTIAPPPVAPKDNGGLRNEVAALLKDQRRAAAITTLRDAVDADPLDLERRTLLVQVLGESDAPAAALEARRAADLAPEKVGMRVEAARAWLRAGRNDEAQKDLNEAVARNPEGSDVRVLLAEVSLRRGDANTALEHLDRAIKTQDTAEARFLRAVCRASLGGIDGVKLDLQAMDKLNPEKSPHDVIRRYDMAATTLDPLFKASADAARSLMQRTIVKPKATETQEALGEARRLVLARVALLAGMPPPSERKASHERWILAHKLLAQSLADLQSFADGGGDEALTEARINLGEAVKQSQAAKQTPTK